MGNDSHSHWLVVSEAAEHLGVAESTVRRRAGRGELRSRRSAQGVLQVQVTCGDQDCAPDTEHQGTAESKPAPPRPVPNKAWAHLATATPNPNAGLGDDLKLDIPLATPETPQADFEPTTDAGQGEPEQADPAQPASTASRQVFPNLTMADIARPADGEEESEVRRFQRLAGASMVLAQRQTDEAHEKLAIVRDELHRARRWGQGATAGAVVCVVLLLFTLVTGGGDPQPAAAESSLSPAERQAQKQRDRELKQTRDALSKMQQELTQTLGRLEQMQSQPSRADPSDES